MTALKTARNSNLELMRIVSILFIIIFHLIYRTFSIHDYQMSSATYLLVRFIIALTLVHVNSFILLTGYFQCEKKLKFSKLLSINNATWFYSILFLLLALFLTERMNIPLVYPITDLDIFKTIIPLDYGLYWYIGLYLLLYLLSPILNTVIANSNQKRLFKIIIVLLLVFSIIPTFTLDAAINTNEGHSLVNFILLYFLGAYLKKYDISKSFLLKRLTDKSRQLLYIVGFISLAFLSLLFLSFSLQLKSNTSNEIINYLSNVFLSFHNSFGSPIVIIQTIFYFLFFTTLNFKSRVINTISKCTLGIYLIHENIYVRDNLYGFLDYLNVKNITIKFIILIFLTAIAIFLVSMVIEILRQGLFKFIYKRKFSCKFRNFYRGYLEKLGFNINW